MAAASALAAARSGPLSVRKSTALGTPPAYAVAAPGGGSGTISLAAGAPPGSGSALDESSWAPEANSPGTGDIMSPIAGTVKQLLSASGGEVTSAAAVTGAGAAEFSEGTLKDLRLFGMPKLGTLGVSRSLLETLVIIGTVSSGT